MNITKHFTVAEFTKSKTAQEKGIKNIPNPVALNNMYALCEHVLEPVREKFGKPVQINSGFRSFELNQAIGGAAKSQHLSGEAADIEIVGVSNREIFEYIRDNLMFDQLILENHHQEVPSSGWVHVSYSQRRNRQQAFAIKQ